MRDRLFTIVDGEPVVTAPLVNLKTFRKLWDHDKSDDKSLYKKWMAYIYHMCDYRSDFYELEDKEKQVLLEVFDRSDISAPKVVQACMEEYKRRNCPVEQRTLDTTIASADNISDNLAELQKDVVQNEKLIGQIERQIENALKADETMIAIELTKEKLAIQKSQLDLVKTSADLIPKLEKNVESVMNLREKVEKSLNKVRESKDLIERFIIDDFLMKKERGEYVMTDIDG